MMNEKAFSFIIYCINSGCDQWPYSFHTYLSASFNEHMTFFCKNLCQKFFFS